MPLLGGSVFRASEVAKVPKTKGSSLTAWYWKGLPRRVSSSRRVAVLNLGTEFVTLLADLIRM